MATLTTPSRVRNRINVTESDISDANIDEYIEDSQADIEAYAERTFAITDDLFGTARSVCTDRAACKALIFFLNLAGAGISYTIDELRIDKSDYRSNKVSLLRMMWARADKNLLLLAPTVATLEPKSTTS
jgi:hypothetical protein